MTHKKLDVTYDPPNRIIKSTSVSFKVFKCKSISTEIPSKKRKLFQKAPKHINN